MHHSLPAYTPACITHSQHCHRGTSSWTSRSRVHTPAAKMASGDIRSIIKACSHGQTVCKEGEEEYTRKQLKPSVLPITHCQHNHRITWSQTDSVQRRGGIAHMEVAKAACIAHGLLNHMHGLIHGLAPLLLALRGHVCITTSNRVQTQL